MVSDVCRPDSSRRTAKPFHAVPEPYEPALIDGAAQSLDGAVLLARSRVLTLEVRKGSRYGFDGQTEIIGDVATCHRQDHYAR
jgi:hypothetical protein